MTSLRNFMVPAAASLALATACGGSSSPGATAASGTPAPAASSSAIDGAVPSNAASASASAAVASANPNGSKTSAPQASSASAAPSANAAAAAVPLPPPGTYKYHVTGNSTTFFGSQQVNDTATLTVDQPAGNREHTKQQDQQGSTEQVLVSESDGLYLAEVHLSQTGFDEDFKPTTKALLFPAKPKQGQQWHWTMTSTDGKYTLQGQLTLADLHSSATTADGKRVPTVAVTSVLHISGNGFDVTVHQRDESGHDAVIVREHAVTNGTAYGTKVQSDVTSVLSRRPA